MGKQKRYIPPWTEGDLITGIDRSYPRSIYRYGGIKELGTKVLFEFLAYGGKSYSPHTKLFPSSVARQYRLATNKDMLEAGYITKSIDFIMGD